MDLNSLPWRGSAEVLQTLPLSFHSLVETVGESKLDINASLYIPSPLNYPIFLALKRSNLTCANGFKSVALLFQIKINMETVLASLKMPTGWKLFQKPHQIYYLALFSLVKLFVAYIHSWLSEQVSQSRAGFGTTFKGTCGYKKAGTSFLRRVNGKNSTNDG
jgi:hypothetical protein